MASSERAGQEEVSRQNTLVIDTRDILLYRGDTTLVGPLNWQVNAGEQWIIFGPNGAGKTSLLHMVGGDLFPSKGTLSVLAVSYTHLTLPTSDLV